MTRKHFQHCSTANATSVVITVAGLLALAGCSSAGRAVSGQGKAPGGATATQPGPAKLEPVSARSGNAPAPELLRGAATRRAADALATLHDDDFGISLQYPWQYGFKSGHKLRSSGEPVETGFVAPGGVNLGTIEVPAGYYTGTDFKRAFLSANVNGKLASDQCSQFSAGQNNESPVPAKMQIGNREFLMQETKADDSIRRTYHTYQSGVCYEFVLGLDTADSNSDQRIKPAPVKRVFARLENILATVDIADQDGTAEASAATGNPVPQKP